MEFLKGFLIRLVGVVLVSQAITATAEIMERLSIRSAVGVLVSRSIAARALGDRLLDPSGAIVGFLLMAIHIAAGYRFGALLYFFFYYSAEIIKIGEELRRRIDDDDYDREGGEWNWIQLLANSWFATILVLVLAVTGGQDMCLDTRKSKLLTGLIGGIIGQYASCNGDTWSSEVGMLNYAQPCRLITNLKDVPKGTNGGVTAWGLLAAASAGFDIGLIAVIFGKLSTCAADVYWKQLLIIPIATAAGLCGSLIDSLLGATLQFTGYCTIRRKLVSKPGRTVVKISGSRVLGNNAVNAVSVLLTASLTALACLYIF